MNALSKSHPQMSARLGPAPMVAGTEHRSGTRQTAGGVQQTGAGGGAHTGAHETTGAGAAQPHPLANAAAAAITNTVTNITKLTERMVLPPEFNFHSNIFPTQELWKQGQTVNRPS